MDFECYLVGGAVRDQLLGLPQRDRDWVVVGATEKAMLAVGFTRVGRDFPVFLHPETHEEYALARTERKQGAGHTGFTVFASPDITLEEDLSRRDLTINAIAIDAAGQLIDPFGGQADLAAQTLRHVSPAFAEDPLRILRVARFAAQLDGFDVAQETLDLMRDMADQNALAELSAERVWQETEKALGLDVTRYFAVLASCHALAPWFVELQDAVVSGLGDDTLARFALLPLDATSIEALAERLKAPKIYRQCALDYRQHGEVLRQWRTVPDLYDTLMALRALQDATRYRRVAHIAGAESGLEELVEGLRAVTIESAPDLGGPAYGQALADARRHWLRSARDR